MKPMESLGHRALFVHLSFLFFFYKQGPAGNVIVLQPTKTAMTFCDIIGDVHEYTRVFTFTPHLPFPTRTSAVAYLKLWT